MRDVRELGRLSFLKEGIAQTAFVVPDLDTAVGNYAHVFGIGPWQFYTYERPLVPYMTYYGEPADYAMRLALSYFGPSRVELIECVRGPTVYEDFVEKHGYGVQHLGFLTSDMKKSLAEARQAGFSVTMEGAGFGVDGDGYYAYLDTEEAFGVVLELIERPRRKPSPERVYEAPSG